MFSYKWLICRMGLSVAIAPGLLIATAVGAQVPGDPDNSESLRENEEIVSLRLPAPRTLDANRELTIEVDGILDDAAWADARVFTGFTQQEPVEGDPAEYDTEVRVLFGDGAIWIGARMWDDHPEGIDARLARRDAFGTFDSFGIMLDPNLDGLTGYGFRVSAANVQSDFYFFNDTSVDQAWDAVWSSEVAVDESGWTAEFRVPLSQFRYEASDEVQTWGANFTRFRVANNERSYYALVSRLRRGMVSQ
ncbi:uncharacterized protein METZ01_LOCUS276334, partial [marine metagenome]